MHHDFQIKTNARCLGVHDYIVTKPPSVGSKMTRISTIYKQWLQVQVVNCEHVNLVRLLWRTLYHKLYQHFHWAIMSYFFSAQFSDTFSSNTLLTSPVLVSKENLHSTSVSTRDVLLVQLSHSFQFLHLDISV